VEKNRRPLTSYGRWIKTTLIERDMNMRDLEAASGVSFQMLSKLMHGYFPGHKHRADIERALGATPPEDIAC
jgi:transcriptional regulator with XRE-family HTH domain